MDLAALHWQPDDFTEYFEYFEAINSKLHTGGEPGKSLKHLRPDREMLDRNLTTLLR